MNLPGENDTMYTAVQLRQLSFHLQEIVDKRMMDQSFWPVDTKVALETVIETMAENMKISLISRLTVQPLDKRSIRYPRDWWEAFKQRWFPVWLLKRYPVQFHVETIEAHAVYPKIALTKGCAGVMYVKTKQGITINGQQMEQLKK